MNAFLTAAWTATLLVTALPATAAAPELDAPTIKVDYSDLNLANSRGVSTLQSRVTGAINQVCGGSAFAVQKSVEQRACESNARAAASRGVQNAITSARESPNTTQAVSSATRVLNQTTPSTIPQHWSGPRMITRH